jgi:hypothetical protein
MQHTNRSQKSRPNPPCKQLLWRCWLPKRGIKQRGGRVIAVHAAVLYVCAIVGPIYPLSADVARSGVGEAKDVADAQRSPTNRFPSDCRVNADDFRRMYGTGDQPYTEARIRKDSRPDREQLAFGNNQLGLSSGLLSIPFAIGEHSDSRCSLVPF